MTLTVVPLKFVLRTKAITSSLAAIASGNIVDAATKITSSLVGILGLGIVFLARVAKLDGIAVKVKGLFQKIREPILKAFTTIVARFKTLVGRGSSKPVTTPKPVTSSAAKPGLKDGIYGKESFIAGKEPHGVWLEVKSGNPKAMIASAPKPAKEQLDDWKVEAQTKGLQAQTSIYFTQAMTIVTRAVNNLKRSGTTTTVGF